MTISTAAKVGSGAIFAAGTPASIYFSWDHITLYSVEREVINRNVKLEKKSESESNKTTVTVKTPDNSVQNDEKLSDGYSWSCVITITPSSTSSTESSTNLWEKLKANLPVDAGDKHLENKKLLVKACAKNREENANNSVVIGKLTVKETDSTKKTFSFEEDPYLNVLLGSN